MESKNIPKFQPKMHLLLTVPEAAAEIGICDRIMYQLARRKDFPTVRIGKRVFISRRGLVEWVRNQEQNRFDVLGENN